MSKKMIYDIEALLKLKQGVNIMVKAIKTTYGPGGKNVLFEEHGKCTISKNGFAVAEQIDLQDPFENIGAELIKQVSKQTAEDVGDGTTTAAILAGELLTEGVRLVAAGVNPNDLQNGINKAYKTAIKELITMSRPVNLKKDLKNIASISVNHDLELSNLITEAFEKQGKDALVQVQKSTGVNSTVEFVEGIEIDGGFLSPDFITDISKNEAMLEDALVLVTNKRISTMDEIRPLLVMIADVSKPIVIIAKDFDTEVLSTLTLNNRSNAIRCIAIKPKLAGDLLNELLEDISLLTDTEVFTEESGKDLKLISIDSLGRADKVISSSIKTGIVGNKNKRTNQLKEFIRVLDIRKHAATGQEITKIDTRLSRLTGEMVLISIGAATDIELTEKLYRTVNGVKAVKAAIEEGIVGGGGIAWIQLSNSLERLTSKIVDEQKGMVIFKKALISPFIALGINAGKEPLPLIERIIVDTENIAFDFQNNQFVRFYEAGIIDPAKVIRVAMKNSVSVVSELLKIKVAIAENKD